MGESDTVRRSSPAVSGLRTRTRRMAVGAVGVAAALILAACAARGGPGADATSPTPDPAHGHGPAQTPPHAQGDEAGHGAGEQHAAGQHGAGHQHDPSHHQQHHAPAGGHVGDHAGGHSGGHAAGHDLPATAGPGYTVADVQFMQHMIGHHAQAIVMARMADSHGAGDRVRVLARKIDISQTDEIAFMEQWLVVRGQAVPTEEQRLSMVMPGILTPEQMARLDAARGAEFDRLFLEFMIHHHRGALEMVEALFSDPGSAQDPDLFRFVTDVDADQRDEIYVMQGMLAMLATTGGSELR